MEKRLILTKEELKKILNPRDKGEIKRVIAKIQAEIEEKEKTLEELLKRVSQRGFALEEEKELIKKLNKSLKELKQIKEEKLSLTKGPKSSFLSNLFDFFLSGPKITTIIWDGENLKVVRKNNYIPNTYNFNGIPFEGTPRKVGDLELVETEGGFIIYKNLDGKEIYEFYKGNLSDDGKNLKLFPLLDSRKTLTEHLVKELQKKPYALPLLDLIKTLLLLDLILCVLLLLGGLVFSDLPLTILAWIVLGLMGIYFAFFVIELKRKNIKG